MPYGMHEVIVTALVGMGGACFPVGFGAVIFRNKTKKEIQKTNAETDDLVTQASERLIRIYEERDKNLEKRISAAEEKAITAETRALRSESAEILCNLKLTDLQAQFSVLTSQVQELMIIK